MKKILLFILFSLSFSITQGQFCSTTALSNRGNLTPTGTFQNVNGNASFKNYWTFTATAGCTYDFSTCSGPNGNDTYLRLYQGITPNTAILRAQNDDNGPFCTGSKASLSWVCPTSGTYSILLTNYSCANLSATTTLSYRVICTPPYNPCSSIPTISACGVTTTANMSGTGAGWSITSCGFSTSGQERIFQFTPTISGTYQLNVSSITGGYVDFFWKQASGGCSNVGWNCIDDINLTGTYSGITSMTFVAGTTYYILLDPETSGTYSVNFSMTCPTPPISVSVGCTGSNFFDSGGNGGNYSINEDRTYIYCPQNSTDKVTINFTSFDIESGFDYLYVYNGNSTTSPLIGTFTGTTTIGPFTSTNTNGCLTFRFTSDGSVNLTGWAANATLTPLVSPTHNTTMLEGCVGINPSLLNFVTSTSGGGQPYNYQWLENGNTIIGTNTTSFDPPSINTSGVYQYNVRVTDACGTIVTSVPKEVRVVPDPTIPSATQVGIGCIGDSVTLINPQYGTEAGAFCQFEYSSSLDNISWTTTSNTIPSFYVNYSISDTNYIRMRVSGGCANGCNASPWMIYRFYNELSICDPLPIYLATFDGHNEGRENHLYWLTDQEINSSHFEIERSNNGYDFIKIGIVQTDPSKSYNFIDNSPYSGSNYYRLKMVDLDETFSYSSIIFLETKNQIESKVYPNPFEDSLIYTYESEQNEELEIHIINILGQKVFQYNVSCQTCGNYVSINTSNIPSGKYTIRIKHLSSLHETIQTMIKK